MIMAQDVLAALKLHLNVLLYGPPGTGKSHLMKEVQNLFTQQCGTVQGNQIVIDTGAEMNAIQTQQTQVAPPTSWVTFHQGYSYEDFILGLRPQIGTNSGGVALQPQAGVLLDLAVRTGPNEGLLLIDEINRGNASKIFGEFITLMEPDKRLDANEARTASTVTITLPYIPEGTVMSVAGGTVEKRFSMPKRVYTLASMNSVDKSVAPLDAAIRRRFHIINLRPSPEDIREAAGVRKGSQASAAVVAVAVLESLNRSIGLYLGPEFMLGQYYLAAEPTLGAQPDNDARKALVALWKYRLLPQVLELFHARPVVCANVLKLKGSPGKSGALLIEPNDVEADDGALAYIVNSAASVDEDEVYEYLQSFVQTAPLAAVSATPTTP